MASGSGIKRLLLGIEVTVFGGVLVLLASGSAGALGLVVAAVGLAIAVSGMGSEPRT
jgi:hypothetical protein